MNYKILLSGESIICKKCGEITTNTGTGKMVYFHKCQPPEKVERVKFTKPER